MKVSLRLQPALAALLLTGAGPVAAQSGLQLSVDLPDSETWNQVSDRAAGQAYSKEWVPAGQNADSASWLIAQQKVTVEPGVDAGEFLAMIYELSENACTSATHDEPERHRIGDFRGVVGRTECAQMVGTNHGAFSDRIVFVEGGYAYIVTSEIRIPPMVVAGVLSFGGGDRDESRAAASEFMERQTRSRELVRDRVSIE
jgi:hypothetical protein